MAPKKIIDESSNEEPLDEHEHPAEPALKKSSDGCKDIGKLCVLCERGFPANLAIALDKSQQKTATNTNLLFHLIADGLNSLGKRDGLMVKDISNFSLSHFNQLEIENLFQEVTKENILEKIKNYMSKYSGWVFCCTKKNNHFLYFPKAIISVYETDITYYSFKRIKKTRPPETVITDTIDNHETKLTNEITENTTHADTNPASAHTTPPKVTSMHATSTDTTSTPTDTEIDEPLALEQAQKRLPVISLEDIEFERKLGEGGWGEVWRCRYGLDIVAVKKVKPEGSASDKNALLKEAALLNSVRSTNIVNVFGIATNDTNDLHVVLEYASQGDLEKYLCKHSKGLLNDWPLLLKLFGDICFGLNCLHTAKTPIIHRDLKLPNILLKKENGELTAMIADLGISKILLHPTKTIYETGVYLAPEIRKNKEYGFPSDVFSLGVIGSQLFYPGWKPTSMKGWIAVLPPLDDSETESRRSFFKMIEQCLNRDPSARPTAHELYETVKKIGKDIIGKPWSRIKLPHS